MTPDEYRQANPLGGPAKLFDAIADRIRAGEDMAAVMDDYDLDFKASDRQRGIAHNQEHATVLTMFLAYMQQAGLWPCAMDLGQPPRPASVADVMKLRDQFVGRAAREKH